MIQKNVSDMVCYHRKLLNNDPNTPCDPENLEIPPDLLNYKGRLSIKSQYDGRSDVMSKLLMLFQTLSGMERHMACLWTLVGWLWLRLLTLSISITEFLLCKLVALLCCGQCHRHPQNTTDDGLGLRREKLETDVKKEFRLFHQEKIAEKPELVLDKNVIFSDLLSKIFRLHEMEVAQETICYALQMCVRYIDCYQERTSTLCFIRRRVLGAQYRTCSRTAVRQMCLSVKALGTVRHFPLQANEAGLYTIDGQPQFPTMLGLINHYYTTRTPFTKNKVKLLSPVVRHDWELLHHQVQLRRKIESSLNSLKWSN
uniref:SH2 domain-containing protein n=1 Tax=Ditylenchus dipsaci TaxID=166011 RepID=A0A915ESL4_9BILA